MILQVNMYLMCKLGLKTQKTLKSDFTHAKSVNSVKIMQNHDFAPEFIGSINTFILTPLSQS